MLPGIRKKTLGAQLSFLARGPQAALDTPTVHEFVLSHTSKLQPRDCPSNWMPPKSPNLLKSSACSPPLLPPPQTSGSPSTMAAPAHLLLKPEAWEPSWMRPPCTRPHQSSPGLGNAASHTARTPTAGPPAGPRCPNLLGHTAAPGPCGLSLCTHTHTLSSAAFGTSCTLQAPPSSTG